MKLLAVTGYIGVALISGAAAAILPYWIIISLVFGVAFLVIIFMRPDYGLLLVLALVSGLVHPAFSPSMGPIKASDLVLAALFLSALRLRSKTHRDFASEFQDISWPFWIFSAIALFAIVYSIVFLGINWKATLGEARDLGYLVLLPLALWIIRDEVDLKRIIRGVVILGFLFSLGQFLQGLLDVPVFGNMGRLETLQTLGYKEHGVTRTLTRGIGIIEFSLLLLTGLFLLREIKRSNYWLAASVLVAAIVLTFGRTTFATTLFAITLVAYLTSLRRSIELVVIGISGIIIVLGILSFVRPALIDGLTYRIMGTTTELSSGASAQWRFYEAETVIPQIQAHPLLGIGLGAEYRHSVASDVVPEQNRYIHNAYLYMAAKLGVPALLVFMWLLAAILRRAWQSACNKEFYWRAFSAATAAAVLAKVLASITEPHFMADYSIAFISLTSGIMLAALRLQTSNFHPASSKNRSDAPVGSRLQQAGHTPRVMA